MPLFLLLPRAYVCLCFAMLALATDSRADAVLLRFMPPNPSSAVAGYKLYFAPQTSGAITSAPVDLGARAPDGSGLASYTLSGLDPKVAYSFELTSYDAKGNQSARSNRLSIDARTEVLGDVLWSSDFSAYAPGVHVPLFFDWRGDTSATLETDLFQVAYFGNDAAFGSAAADGAVATRFLGSRAPGWGSYEVSGRVWTSGTSAEAGVALHDTDGDPDRAFVFGQTPVGTWFLRGQNEPALSCKSGVSTGVTQPAATWYSFRVRVTRAAGLTRLRAMICRTGAAASSVICQSAVASSPPGQRRARLAPCIRSSGR